MTKKPVDAEINGREMSVVDEVSLEVAHVSVRETFALVARWQSVNFDIVVVLIVMVVVVVVVVTVQKRDRSQSTTNQQLKTQIMLIKHAQQRPQNTY